MSAHVHSYISQYYSNSWHETTLDHLRGRNDNWAIRHDDRSRYGKYFERYQKYNKRPMTRAIFAQYYTWKQVIDPVKDGLQELVAFQLADYDEKGYLDLESYIVACHLLNQYPREGMPKDLPPDLIPLSKQHYHLGGAQDVSVLAEKYRQLAMNSSSHTNVPPTSFRPEECVSDELWIMIFERTRKSALKEVCKVSKRFRAIAIPVLYGEINLSGPAPSTINDDRVRNREPPIEDTHALVQQYRFMKQILRTPEYAPLVKKFVWKMDLSPHCYQLPYFVDDERSSWNYEELYTMFSLLTNVRHLDLDTGWEPPQEPHKPITSLFPKAKFVRLKGIMIDSLVVPILYGPEKPEIRSLTLGSVFKLRFPNPIVGRWDKSPEARFWLRNRGSLLGEGNMTDHPPRELQWRCANLESLSLVKFRVYHITGFFYSINQPLTRSLTSREKRLYSEWAALISAAKPKRLFISHVLPPTVDNLLPRFSLFPVNKVFRDLLLPVLIRGWEGLERLELRGVELKDEGSLRKSLPGVEVVIDPKMDVVEVLP